MSPLTTPPQSPAPGEKEQAASPSLHSSIIDDSGISLDEFIIYVRNKTRYDLSYPPTHLTPAPPQERVVRRVPGDQVPAARRHLRPRQARREPRQGGQPLAGNLPNLTYTCNLSVPEYYIYLYISCTCIFPEPVFYLYLYFTCTCILPEPASYTYLFLYLTFAYILPVPVFYLHMYITNTCIIQVAVSYLYLYLYLTCTLKLCILCSLPFPAEVPKRQTKLEI